MTATEPENNNDTDSVTRDEEKSLFIKLKERRMFRIMGAYLVASFTIVQFVEWVVNRYLFSPHLVELSFVILVSLIPSMMIISYYHGRPGRDKWRPIEKIGIPLNIMLCLILTFTIFNGKDLGRVSQKVTLTDEKGNTVEREVPKANFRKKITLFYMDNKSGDKSLDWLQYGTSMMLEGDLGQDLFMDLKSPTTMGIESSSLDYYVYDKIKESGFKEPVGLPLVLKKKIARAINTNYFLSGSIDKKQDDYIIETTIYQSDNAKPEASQTVRGKNIFKLIDQLSVQIKKDLQIPQRHLDTATDLPVEELFTQSIDAVRLYTLGLKNMFVERNWVEAQQLLEQATQKDPTFAVAYGALITANFFSGNMEKYSKNHELLMKYIYKLPERDQYHVKLAQYVADYDFDKQKALLDMIIKLYPDDIRTRAMTASLMSTVNKHQEAIKQYEEILKIDPERYEILPLIARQYELLDNREQADAYYKKYMDHLPQTPDAFIEKAKIVYKEGKIDEAKKLYENALLIEPGNITILTALADITMNQGQFDKADNQLQEALKSAKTPKDKAEVFQTLTELSNNKGQMKKTLEYWQAMLKEWEKFQKPFLVNAYKVSLPIFQIKAGNTDKGLKLLDETLKNKTVITEMGIYFSFIEAHLYLKNYKEARKWLDTLKESQMFKTISSNGKGSFHLVDFAEGRLCEANGQYDEALEIYKKGIKNIPKFKQFKYRSAICQRKLKQFDDAKNTLQQLLKKDPYDAEYNNQMALVYVDSGDKEKGLEHLERAVNIWKDADPDFKPAKIAKEKLKELKN